MSKSAIFDPIFQLLHSAVEHEINQMNVNKSYLAAAMSSLGLGGLCFAEPFVAAGAWVIGMVVCVVDPELGLLCDVPFEDTDREGVERGVVELLEEENFDCLLNSFF